VSPIVPNDKWNVLPGDIHRSSRIPPNLSDELPLTLSL
jgi:hypothetical protein